MKHKANIDKAKRMKSDDVPKPIELGMYGLKIMQYGKFPILPPGEGEAAK